MYYLISFLLITNTFFANKYFDDTKFSTLASFFKDFPDKNWKVLLWNFLDKLNSLILFRVSHIKSGRYIRQENVCFNTSWMYSKDRDAETLKNTRTPDYHLHLSLCCTIFLSYVSLSSKLYSKKGILIKDKLSYQRMSVYNKDNFLRPQEMKWIPLRCFSLEIKWAFFKKHSQRPQSLSPLLLFQSITVFYKVDKTQLCSTMSFGARCKAFGIAQWYSWSTNRFKNQSRLEILKC